MMRTPSFVIAVLEQKSGICSYQDQLEDEA